MACLSSSNVVFTLSIKIGVEYGDGYISEFDFMEIVVIRVQYKIYVKLKNLI